MAPPLRFGLLPLEAFALSVLSLVIDALRRGGSEAAPGVEWAVLTPDGAPLRAENGIVIQPDALLSRAADHDCLVLIGRAAALPPAVADALRAAVGRGCPVLALGAAPDQSVRWPGAPPITGGAPEDIDRLIGLVLADLRGGIAAPLAGFFPQGTALRDPLVARALRIMQEHIETPRMITELAAAMGVGRRKLERRFRADMGVSPQSAYTMLRLERAAQLLRDTPEPLSEIALSCGFCDSSHLVRTMKARLGLSPGQLRNRPATPAPRAAPWRSPGSVGRASGS